MEKIAPEYDVVVVGAGPAGCITANFLSQKYRVLLLDWSRFPRDKPCGGILVEESGQFLQKLGKIPAGIFSYPKMMGIRYVDFDNSFEAIQKRSLLNISRRIFDYWLLRRTTEHVQFVPETKFLNFEQQSKHVKILLERHNKKFFVKTKCLVGADGALSSIRARISSMSVRQYFAIQEWIKTDFDTKDVIFIYDNIIGDGYSWIIPKRNYIIAGLAVKIGDNVENKLALFKNRIAKKLGLYGKVLKKEGAVSLRPQSKRDCILGQGNVLLVGEAAGLISPATGEGISFALRSGHACAQALNIGLRDGLERYKRFCQPLLKEIDMKAKKASILSDPVKRLQLLKHLVDGPR